MLSQYPIHSDMCRYMSTYMSAGWKQEFVSLLAINTIDVIDLFVSRYTIFV